MEGTPQEPKPGLIVRLIASVLANALFFGILWPPGSWRLGDSKGFAADFKEGLTIGAIVGVLSVFLAGPLARLFDKVLRRRKADSSGR